MPSQTDIETKGVSHAKSSPTSTHDHLVDVGLALMRKQGYGATGLQEILQAAGVPKGSFYHHFASKEEFTAAVIERYFTRASEFAQKHLLEEKDHPPLGRLRRYFEALVKTAGQSAPLPGCLLGDLSLEVADASPLLQRHLSDSFTGWQAGVGMVLREAVERGELPKSTKVESLAGFILNSWEGALLRSQADKSDAPLKDFLHFVFEDLLVA